MPYKERFKMLNWNSLEHRREYLSLIECYKIVFGVNGLDSLMTILSHVGVKQLLANHQYKIHTKSARVNCFKYSFFERIIRPWNNLPNHVFERGISVKGFKSHLKTLINIH